MAMVMITRDINNLTQKYFLTANLEERGPIQGLIVPSEECFRI